MDRDFCVEFEKMLHDLAARPDYPEKKRKTVETMLLTMRNQLRKEGYIDLQTGYNLFALSAAGRLFDV